MIFRRLGPATTSWITPKAKKGLPSKVAGRGLVAVAKIKKDELVMVKGGRIIDKQALDANRQIIKGAELQLYDDLFLAPLTKKEFEPSMGYVNHSCEPNIGYGGNILAVAMRDIEPGEEILLDYAMMRSDKDYRFECGCRTKSCRKVITGSDWRIAGLQKKYEGYFQWYLSQKIKNQKTGT